MQSWCGGELQAEGRHHVLQPSPGPPISRSYLIRTEVGRPLVPPSLKSTEPRVIGYANFPGSQVIRRAAHGAVQGRGFGDPQNWGQSSQLPASCMYPLPGAQCL